MLDSIRSYFYPALPMQPPLVEPPPPAPPPFDAAEINRRLDALKDQTEEYLASLHTPTAEEQKEIERIMKSMPERSRKAWTRTVYDCQIAVTINPEFTEIAAAAPFSKIRRKIYLHPLMILKPTDLPKDLHLNGPDDSINNDYLKRLINWICEKFDLKESQLGDPTSFRDLFQFYCKYLWRNPEKISHVRDFILAHEVGHLHQPFLPPTWYFYVAIAITCCIVTILWMGTSLLVVIPSTIITFQIAHFALKWFAYKYHAVKDDEKMADLVAFKLLKTTEGAEIAFEAWDKTTETIWKNTPWYNKVLDAVFFPSDFIESHPTIKERIANLKEAQSLQRHLPQPLKA